jgi:hypothetical protein
VKTAVVAEIKIKKKRHDTQIEIIVYLKKKIVLRNNFITYWFVFERKEKYSLIILVNNVESLDLRYKSELLTVENSCCNPVDALKRAQYYPGIIIRERVRQLKKILADRIAGVPN